MSVKAALDWHKTLIIQIKVIRNRKSRSQFNVNHLHTRVLNFSFVHQNVKKLNQTGAIKQKFFSREILDNILNKILY